MSGLLQQQRWDKSPREVVGAEVEAAKNAGLNWILKNREGSSGSQKAKE